MNLNGAVISHFYQYDSWAWVKQPQMSVTLVKAFLDIISRKMMLLVVEVES